MLSKKRRETILDLQKRYPEKRSALIPALHIAQEELGYLSSEIQDEVAELFGISKNDVYAVVSFYDMFFEEPVGKEVIHVCKNISCMLRGADSLVDAICKKLKTNPGLTSENGQYTIIPSECLGACDRAPMMIVGEKVFGPVSEEDLRGLFNG